MDEYCNPWTFVCLTVALALTRGAIDPTSTQTNLEIYNASASTTTYQQGSIECSQLDCQVLCESANLCTGLNIVVDPDITASFSLSCSGTRACSGIQIHGGATINTQITCGEYRSCENAWFNISNSRNVNVSCVGLIEDSFNCADMQLYLEEGVSDVNVACQHRGCYQTSIDAKAVTGHFDLFCGEHGSFIDLYCPTDPTIACNIVLVDSQHIVDIHIPTVTANLNLECDLDHGSCTNVDIICSDTGGSSDLWIFEGEDRWHCATPYCCPPAHSGQVIACGAGEDCSIDCTTTNCASNTVDGTLAQSLTVDCSLAGACKGAIILCPTSNDRTCSVQCISGSCPFTVIEAASSQSLDLECIGTSACTYMSVFCPTYAPNVCHVGCSQDSNSCETSYIYVEEGFISGYLDITCGTTQDWSYNNYPCRGVAAVCAWGHDVGIRGVGIRYNSSWECWASWTSGSGACCPWYPTPNPTNAPTAPPSFSPTLSPTDSTANPTPYPIVQQRVPDDPTTTPTSSPVGEGGNNNSGGAKQAGGLSTEMWIIAVLGGIVVLGACAVLVWCKFWKNRVEVDAVDQDQVQLTTSAPNTTTPLATNGTADADTAAVLNLPDSPKGSPQVVPVNNEYPDDSDLDDPDTDENEALYDNEPGAGKPTGGNGDDDSSGDELYDAVSGNTQGMKR